MSASAFLRKNFVAVIGVALPLLLVLMLVVLRGIPASRVPQPRHDLLIVSQNYGNPPMEFSVERGKLKVRYLPAQEEIPGQLVRKAPELLYMDVDQQSVRPIPIELPVDKDGKLSDQVQIIELPQVAGLTLSADSVAPDGYRLEHAEHSGGLFGGIFGSGHRNQYVLAKDGRRIRLPDTEDRYNVQVVGWVIGGELGE